MKLLHIGDAHLGKSQYKSKKRYEDMFDAFEESVETAAEEDVEAVIQTGDLFDSPNPSSGTIYRCVDILKTLDSEGIPFYAIVGNHERKRTNQWIDIVTRLIDSAERLSTVPEEISDGDESVALYGIDAVRNPEWSSTDFSLEEPTFDESLSILCMHELLSPPIYNENDEGMSTRSTEEIFRRIEKDIDILALGDYHKPVSDTLDETYIYYAGATERTSRDQECAEYTLLEITDGNFERTRINTTVDRPFIEIEFELDGSETLEDIYTRLSKEDFTPPNKKNSVGVVVLSGHRNGLSVSEVERALRNHGASVINVIDEREISEDLAVSPSDLDDPQGNLTENIDEGIAELELSATTQDVESIVRDTDVPKSHIRDRVEDLLDSSEDNGGDTNES